MIPALPIATLTLLPNKKSINYKTHIRKTRKKNKNKQNSIREK